MFLKNLLRKSTAGPKGTAMYLIMEDSWNSYLSPTEPNEDPAYYKGIYRGEFVSIDGDDNGFFHDFDSDQWMNIHNGKGKNRWFHHYSEAEQYQQAWKQTQKVMDIYAEQPLLPPFTLYTAEECQKFHDEYEKAFQSFQAQLGAFTLIAYKENAFLVISDKKDCPLHLYMITREGFIFSLKEIPLPKGVRV